MDLISELKKTDSEVLLRENESMRDHSTIKAGGNARYFAEPGNEDELTALLRAAKACAVKVFILGNGSNILVSDDGFDGLVIKIGKGFSGIDIVSEDTNELMVEVGAGCLLSVFGNTVASKGFKGSEFCCGIPGSVGGAVFMNAGAYGDEMKDIITEVTYIDPESLKVAVCGNSECGFGYRTSVFEKKGYIVVKARARFLKGDADEISSRVAELRGKRTASQPLEHPSAGSTFKRPEGYYAGALIQEAGLKGFALDDSGAMVSEKHAGFVVNIGGKASASDIYRLICYIIETVYNNSGVRLEPEVRLIGFDGRK